MMTLSDWQLALLDEQRVAHLATVGADGGPAVVPVVYAWDGQRVLTPLDGKPKRTGPLQLRRVRDILAQPRVALVVDRYAEDWSQLAWVQLRGPTQIIEAGEVYAGGLALLHARYPQYQRVLLDGRPLIVITPETVRAWRAQG